MKTKQLQVILVIVDGARKASGIENYRFISKLNSPSSNLKVCI